MSTVLGGRAVLAFRGGALSLLFRCHVDQGAGIGVFQHPQRAIRAFFHIADAFPYIPALGGFGAAMAVEGDADERLGRQTAYEAAAVPLREGLGALVEHQVARRDHRHAEMPCIRARARNTFRQCPLWGRCAISRKSALPGVFDKLTPAPLDRHQHLLRPTLRLSEVADSYAMTFDCSARQQVRPVVFLH